MSKEKLAKVYHYDLFGKRDEKYKFLEENSINSVEWNELDIREPDYYFDNKDYKNYNSYAKGFLLKDCFNLVNSGIKSHRDNFVYDIDKDILEERIKFFKSQDISENSVITTLKIKSNRDWDLTQKRKLIQQDAKEINHYFKKVDYKPFDTYYCFYNLDALDYHRNELMKHMNFSNFSLMSSRKSNTLEFNNIFISRFYSDIHTICDQTYVFPLYLYPEVGEQATLEQSGEPTTPSFGHPSRGVSTTPSFGHPSIGGELGRIPNLDMKLVGEIAKGLGLEFRDVAPWDEATTLSPRLTSFGTPPEECQPPRPSDTPPKEGNEMVEDAENSPPKGGVGCEASRGGSKIGRSYLKYSELPYNPKLKQRAKDLRKAGVLSEVLMWNQLKKSQVEGLDFDRQKIIGSYIVDFFNANLGLVIEIDGSSHDDKQEYDEHRQAFLEGLGLIVIRYQDREVKNNMDGVITNLKEVCRGLLVEESSSQTPTTPSSGHLSKGVSTTPSSGHPSKGVSTTPSSGHPSFGGVDHAESVRRGGSKEYFAPIDLLDYIYAVLHSPTYREKYKEFLKIDFPRVPYPKDKKKFWELVDLGSQIRQLHLLETADKYMTSYPIDGTNIITRKMTKNSMGYEHTGNGVGRVWINDEQYFDGVPEVAWEFYIGGYQPAQKWLKDRVSTPLNNPRPLTYEDINHYQKIIVALTETDRLMKEVDRVGVE